MHNLRLVVVVILVVSVKNVWLKPRDLPPDAGLDINELLAKYGYPLESHEVQTEDGYLLTLHRIPHAGNSSQTALGPPVLVMHGLLCSSVDWINLGPGNALALLLADNGYDVWLGNQRGNTFSRKHVTLDPDEDAEKFFDFSFHEIGVYDLAAKIDYILNTTNQEQLVYVGYSQGTTAFFALTSEKPEYNSKIKLMSALAPVVYTEHLPHPLIKLIAGEYDLIAELFDHLKIYEFLPHTNLYNRLGDTVCNEGSEYQSFCVLILNILGGFDTLIDPNFLPVILTNAPAGASVKQILHYLQEINSQNFAQFDYGSNENINLYGQSTPPNYNVTKITSPVSLHNGKNDWLSDVEDVDHLAKELPNLVGSKLVPWDTFSHLDFTWARDVANLLYDDIIAEIKAAT